MARTGQEIELRLRLDAGPALEAARALLAGASPRRLRSTYYDTSDAGVRALGYALRLREEGGVFTQTLKATGAGLRRFEDERPAPDGALDAAALSGGPLRGILAEGAALAPAFVTEVTRRSQIIARAGADIEASLDEGEIQCEGRSAPILELELELKRGDPAALFDLARSLAAEAPVFLGFQSKSDRGYCLRAGDLALPRKFSAPDLNADMTTGEVFAVAARTFLAQLAFNAALVAGDGLHEAAHQARVGLRRLRTTFKIFKDILDADAAQPLIETQRWLARELEQARNLDVFQTETLEPALKAGVEDLAPLTQPLEAARSLAYARAEAACASERYRLFLIDAARFIEVPPKGRSVDQAKRAERSCLHAMGRILKKRWRALKTAAERVDWGEVEDRHRLRIEAKRLRYAADIFASLAVGKAKTRRSRFLSALERLQDSLGALNDIRVAKEVVSLAAAAAPNFESARAAGRAGEAALAQRGDEGRAALRSAKRAAQILIKTPPWW